MGNWGRALAALVLIGALAFALVVLPVADWLQAALTWAQGNRSVSWLVFALIYVVATVIAFPVWILTVAGGYLFGVAGGVAVVSCSAVLGCTAAFVISRTVARDWVQRRFGRSARFTAIDRAIQRRALFIVLLMRLSVVIPYNVLNYMFGLTAVSLRHYVLGTWAGMLPAVVLYVLVGRSARDLDAIFAGDVEVGMAGKALLIAGVVLVAVVVAVITRTATRALREELGKTESA